MLTITILSLILLSVESASVKFDCIYPNRAGNQAEYYWRDYFDVVPNDAVPGGYKADGTVTYIAQMSDLQLPMAGTYPGTIYPGQKEGVICNGKRFVDASYVKILCSNPRNKFEWIKTTTDEIILLTDYYWVIGGNQPGEIFNIGRVNFEGEVQVGRVYTSNTTGSGLWVCNKAGFQINFKSFELLVLPR